VSPSIPRPVRIATRASRLAVWQAEHVAELLRGAWPGLAVEVVHVTTTGDRNQNARLSAFGGFGVFTHEVQKAVLDGTADLAVHSLKDLPTEASAGLDLAAVPSREHTADALVLSASATKATSLDALPRGARLGTGSLRRRAQLLHRRPDFQISDVRGNVETRLKKLDAGDFDALVLAAAGLKRLGLASRVSFELAPPLMFPAVGQGALGIECREGDAETKSVVARIEDTAARSRVTAERALLARLRAGCHAPVGAATQIEKEQLLLEAVVLSQDGKERVFAASAGPAADPASLGQEVAVRLLQAGADGLLSSK
jgi:hydroxymethylbilane synthase